MYSCANPIPTTCYLVEALHVPHGKNRVRQGQEHFLELQLVLLRLKKWISCECAINVLLDVHGLLLMHLREILFKGLPVGLGGNYFELVCMLIFSFKVDEKIPQALLAGST